MNLRSVEDLLDRLPPLEAEPGATKPFSPYDPYAPMDFSDAQSWSVQELLERDVVVRKAGGTDGVTRFDAINTIVALALSKTTDYEVARVLAEHRCRVCIEDFDEKLDVFESALRKFSRNDKERELVAAVAEGREIEERQGEEQERLLTGIKAHAVNNWAQEEPGKREFLVKGLVQAHVPQMLVADGGIGKTMLALDLAMKIAGYAPGDEPPLWMGQPLTHHCMGGTVIMLTAEDDREELNRRMRALDPSGRFLTHDRLIVVSLIDAGGAFPFVQYAQGSKGIMEPNPRWELFSQALTAFKQEHDVKMVIIDTLNATLHGDENSSVVVQEWFRVVGGSVCRETNGCKPALMVTHHTRKPGKEERIECAADMRQAVRGSGALLNSVRSAIGIWANHEHKAAFVAAIIKANNPEVYRGEMAMIRDDAGVLITSADAEESNDRQDMQIEELSAWIEYAVEKAAEARDPLLCTMTSLKARMEILPPPGQINERLLGRAIRQLAGEGRIKHTFVGGKKCWDVPGGPYHTGIATSEEVQAFDVAPNGVHYTDGMMVINGRVVPNATAV